MTTAAALADEMYCDLRAALATIDGYATGNPWYYIECYRLAGDDGGVLDRWPDIATDDGAGVTIKHPGTGRAVSYTRKTDNRADGQRLRDSIEAVMLWRAEQVASSTSPKADDTGSETSQPAYAVALENLRPSWRRARLALEAAQTAMEAQLTYEQAWKWLNENGFDGYKLPIERTYCDYCSKAAKQLDEPRKEPRGGRDGRSIVKQSEL